MDNLLNSISFALRERAWGRLKLRPGLPEPVVTSVIERERAFYRLVLTKALMQSETKVFSTVIDVGCRNWSYARALADIFPSASLVGVELDGGRRYWNLHRRMDQALSYARALEREGRKAHCLFKDFRETTSDEIKKSPEMGRTENILYTFFFPFVSEDPCLSWGLPRDHADFSTLLTHARKLSDSFGAPFRFLSVHQGEWELELAKSAYARLGLGFKEFVLQPTEYAGLWPSDHEIFILSVH